MLLLFRFHHRADCLLPTTHLVAYIQMGSFAAEGIPRIASLAIGILGMSVW